MIGDAEIDEFFDKLSAGAADYEVPAGMTDAPLEMRRVRIFSTCRDAGGDAIAAMINDAHRSQGGARAAGPRASPMPMQPLAGHVLAMVFEKNSTRTRVSFDIAMRQLGGSALILDAGTTQLGRGEIDRRYRARAQPDGRCDHDPHRRSRQDRGNGASRHVPVINGLTDRSHPCQIVADLLTMIEHGKALPGLEVAWLGDGNNVLHSILEAAALMKFNVRVATPQGYEPGGGVRADGARRWRAR